ncbi:MAG: hypothetical protein ACUVQ0_02585 [Thermoproteota archaeon]
MRRIAVALAVIISLALTVARGEKPAEYLFPKINVLEEDIFIIMLYPPVENLQIDVKTYDGGYSSLVMTNSSLGVRGFPNTMSLIQFLPKSSNANLTITFKSNSTVRMICGALTNNYTYYKPVSDDYYTFSNGILVILPPQALMPPGVFQVTFLINRVSREASKGFIIDLPPLLTLIPIIAIIILIIYIDAYVVVDSYYLSIKEELSKIRKFSLIILILLSILTVYWLLGIMIKF